MPRDEDSDYKAKRKKKVEPKVVYVEKPITSVEVTVKGDDLQSVFVNGVSVDLSLCELVVDDEAPVTPPPSTKNIYRVLNDLEIPDYGYMSRTATDEWKNKGKIDPETGEPVGGNPITPATVKLHGTDPVTKFPKAAAKLVEDLNEPHNTFGYVIREAAGWSNRGQTWPYKMEPIVFEGNVVEVTRIEGKRAYIRTWNGETDDPCVIHRWTNIDEAGNLMGAQNPAAKGDGYIVLAYPGEYWIELTRIRKVE